MRFTAGCLVGVILGIIVAAMSAGAYLFFSTREDLPLFPVSSSGDAEVTITVREAFLNHQMQSSLRAQGLNVSDPSFNLHAPNRATASGNFTFVILQVPVTVRPTVNMHFVVTNGQVAFEIDQVDVSGFAIPQDLVNRQVGNFKQVVQNQLNADIKNWLAGTGLHVVDVQATEAELLVRLGR